MKYELDEKNFRIKLEGSKEEIKTFGRCLVEIVNKSELGMFEDLKFENELEEFNLNSYQRIYINNNSLIYLPNVNSVKAKEFHFKIIKKFYDSAKKIYEEKY